MTFSTVIGLAAGAFTTVAFVPQVIKTYRSQSSEDLSLGMFSLMVTGVIFWLAYGLLTRDIPIILANIVTLTLQLAVLAMMLGHRRKRPGM